MIGRSSISRYPARTPWAFRTSATTARQRTSWDLRMTARSVTCVAVLPDVIYERQYGMYLQDELEDVPGSRDVMERLVARHPHDINMLSGLLYAYCR